MDTDAIPHGNLEFKPELIFGEAEEDGSQTETTGTRDVAIYVIHKNVLNAVKQMRSLNLLPVEI